MRILIYNNVAMDIREEMYKTVENSNITVNSEYSFSSSVEEIAEIMDNKPVELIIVHCDSEELKLLVDLIKGKSTRILLIGCPAGYPGVNLLCGQRTSSWHEAIPFEFNHN